MTFSSYSFGVILPLFNKELLIERALLSIKNQEVSFDQVIVVNDCSTDHSLDVVYNFKMQFPEFPLLIIEHEVNKGPGAARNSGIEALNSDYFCFLDADDYFMPGFLKAIKGVINSSTLIQFLIFQIRESSSSVIRPSVNYLKKCSHSSDSSGIFVIQDWVSAMVEEPLFCSGSNVIMSKELVGQIRFDLNSRNFEDWDFYFRVCSFASENLIPIKFFELVGLIYTDDDLNSLSRSNNVSNSLLVIPPLVKNGSLPLNVRSFTYGVWLLHVSQRIGFWKGLRLIFKVILDVNLPRPNFKIVLASIGASLLGPKGWSWISSLRKRIRYV